MLQVDVRVQFYNCSSRNIGGSVLISSPFYTDDALSISDKRWTAVRVPIGLLVTTDAFCGFSLTSANSRPVQICILNIHCDTTPFLSLSSLYLPIISISSPNPPHFRMNCSACFL